MSYDYDALYGQQVDALGAPSKVFVDFFAQYGGDTARVLDVGCGQGRDALMIARLGHSVVGVDLSRNGVRDMTAAAEREGLCVTGIVADIADFTPDGAFDIVVVDRTLHMLDAGTAKAVLARLLDCASARGWVLIEDEPSNIAGFEGVIAAQTVDWVTAKQKRGTLFIQRAT